MECLGDFPCSPTAGTGVDDGLSDFYGSDWADWGTSSMSRNLSLYTRSLIIWRSKKHKVYADSTALSTAEAKYYSASTVATELRNLLENMGFAQPGPTPMYEDNTASIEWGNHVIGGRERTEHIYIRKHFAY